MARFNVDFTNSEKTDHFSGTGVAPEGWHKARITRADLKEGRDNPDVQYINYEFSLLEYNQKCFFNCFINGLDKNNALFTICQVVGYKPPKSKGALDTNAFINKVLDIEVKHFQQVSNKDGKEYTNLRLTNVRPCILDSGSDTPPVYPEDMPSQQSNEDWL